MKTIAAVLLFLALAPSALAIPDPEFELILVPVFASAPGANGSQWETSVDITSNGDQGTIRLARPAVVFEHDLDCGNCESRDVPARMSVRLSPTLQSAAGVLLWVPRTEEDEVAVSARVRDISQNATSAGTFVPAIRESELTRAPLVLLDVPTDPRFRASLRLYDAYNIASDVIVQIYDMAQYRNGFAPPLVDTVIKLHAQSPEERFPEHPAFASIGDLVAAYPQLAAAQSVAIVAQITQPLISPPLHAERFYALASTTNNTTQEVTIISPR